MDTYAWRVRASLMHARYRPGFSAACLYADWMASPADHVPRSVLVGDAAHQVFGEPAGDRQQYGLLVGVVGVDGGPGQVGPVADVVHGDPLIPLLEHQLGKRVLDRRRGTGHAPLVREPGRGGGIGVSLRREAEAS